MTLYDHSSSPFHLGPFKAEGSTVGRCDFIYVRESIQLSCTSKTTNQIANSAAELHIKPIFTSPGDTPAVLHASNIELQSNPCALPKTVSGQPRGEDQDDVHRGMRGSNWARPNTSCLAKRFTFNPKHATSEICPSKWRTADAEMTRNFYQAASGDTRAGGVRAAVNRSSPIRTTAMQHGDSSRC